jgi:hypothetical protein
MAIDVRLDRNYYHLHVEIGRWCEDYFGPVDFYSVRNPRWQRNIIFGYQDYTFEQDEDATFFILKWINGKLGFY